MTTVRANGLAVHVQQLEPAGAPGANGVPGQAVAPAPIAVMIHGMTSDSLASWYFTLAKPFTDAGIRVIMYDLRGHGLTERPPVGYRLDDFVDDLEALLAELGIAEPVHLVGNSFGGTIAFGYALRHPDRVAGIAAIESSPPTRVWFSRLTYRLDRAASYLPQRNALAEITASRGRHAARRAAEIHQMLACTSILRDLPTSRLPATDQLSTIGCPVLCVYGGESGAAELAPVVRRLLPGARTVTVPGQKHSLLVDQPETVRQLILSWLHRQCGLDIGTPTSTDQPSSSTSQ